MKLVCNPSRVRSLAFALLLLLVWQTVASPILAGEPEPPATPAAAAAEPESSNFLWDVITNLFNTRELLRILGQPQFVVAAFVVLNVIVFVETGLLVGFCLPGDTLLVAADSVGYYIGYRTGPRIFSRENSLLFHKDHLLKAQRFYERHGGKTIVLARFMPVIRAFAPVVAGVGRMEYRRFVFYNVFGGIGWVCGMILFGYWLPELLNAPLRQVFGPGFDVVDHIEKVVIVVALVSVAPPFVAWLRHRSQKNALAAQKSAA
jgi:membrane-associated protein